jgi:hypothetical protein
MRALIRKISQIERKHHSKGDAHASEEAKKRTKNQEHEFETRGAKFTESEEEFSDLLWGNEVDLASDVEQEDVEFMSDEEEEMETEFYSKSNAVDVENVIRKIFSKRAQSNKMI